MYQSALTQKMSPGPRQWMPAPKKSGSSRRKALHHGHAAPLCFRGAPASARLTRAGPLERRERKLFLMFLAPGLLGIGAIFLPVLYAIQLSFYYAESFVDAQVCRLRKLYPHVC